MRYGSVCSGIEAATVAWHPLGWEPAWFSEIEPFPSSVLAHHYPEVPNLGDMTCIADRILAGEVEAPDLLVGGTPCQAFSVAGQRQSLADARGNLTLTFVVLADAIGSVRSAAGLPGPIIVWENVPGVLNTPDNAFGCFLGGLAGSDEALRPVGRKWPRAGVVHGSRRRVAWCVLDAQFFGVAQRRRRVFVVAVPNELVERLGDRAHPAEILSIGKGLRRDTPTRRQAGEGAAAGFETDPGGGRFTDLSPTLDCRAKNGPMQNQLGAGVVQPLGLGEDGELARALNGCPTASGRHDASVDTFVAGPLMASGKAAGSATQQDAEQGMLVAQPIYGIDNENNAFNSDGVCGPLMKDSPSGGGRPLPAIAHPQTMAFKIRGGSPTDTGANGSETPGRAAGKGFLGSEEKGFTIGATQDQFLAAPTTAFQSSQSGVREVDTHATLDANNGSRRHNGVIQAMQVRRLTPRECERLQGFPDDFTRIPWRGKPAEDCPDGPRYKALGNSMAVPVMAWIGRRIQQVEALR